MHQTALGGSVKKKTRAFPIPCLGALSAQKLLQLCTSLPEPLEAVRQSADAAAQSLHMKAQRALSRL